MNPDAIELCNGVDDRCDGDASDAGRVTAYDADGMPTDISGTFEDGGGFDLELDAARVVFCEGNYDATLQLTGDIDLVGRAGSAATTLDAAGTGRTVTALVDEAHVSLEGLTLTGGVGDDSTIGIGNAGGGLLCIGNSSLSLDDVHVTGNAAEFGGGLFSFGCDLAVTDSAISDNTAENDAGGAMLIDGGHDLQDVEIADNEATGDVGGLWLLGMAGTADSLFDHVHVTRNIAGETVGGVRLEEAALSWLGSPSVRSGITDNTASAIDNMQLSQAEFASTEADFGEPGTDDFTADITLPDSGFAYAAQDDASFVCDGERCGESTAHEVAHNNNSWSLQPRSVFGNVFEAELDHTLDSFSIDMRVGSECLTWLHVLTHTALDGTWDVAWTSEPIDGPYSREHQSSGPIGLVIEPGRYYALMAYVYCEDLRRDTSVHFGGLGSEPLDGGFGTTVGTANVLFPADLPWGATQDLETETAYANRYEMTVHTTEL